MTCTKELSIARKNAANIKNTFNQFSKRNSSFLRLTLSTSNIFNARPSISNHAEMVENMEKRYLIRFLSKGKDDSI